MLKKIMIMLSLVALMVPATMSAKVIGKVNGYPITERDANAFLKVVTKGEIKYQQLSKKDKKDVVKHLAVSSLLTGMAKKSLSRQEINQLIVNYWLSTKIKNIKIKPEDIKNAYIENKELFKGSNNKILPFEKVKNNIEISLKQKKYVTKLMESAKITMGNIVIVSPKKVKRSGASSKVTKSTYKGKTKIYKVQSGNTLSGIAYKYHITISQLRDINGMSVNDTLRIGQKLKVPVR